MSVVSPVKVDNYQAAFGQHIRQIRQTLAVSQEEIAHRAGIHVTYLSGVERGVRNPSLKNIRAIALALGVGVADLFAFEAEGGFLRRVKENGNNHS